MSISCSMGRRPFWRQACAFYPHTQSCTLFVHHGSSLLFCFGEIVDLFTLTDYCPPLPMALKERPFKEGRESTRGNRVRVGEREKRKHEAPFHWINSHPPSEAAAPFAAPRCVYFVRPSRHDLTLANGIGVLDEVECVCVRCSFSSAAFKCVRSCTGNHPHTHTHVCAAASSTRSTLDVARVYARSLAGTEGMRDTQERTFFLLFSG